MTLGVVFLSRLPRSSFITSLEFVAGSSQQVLMVFFFILVDQLSRNYKKRIPTNQIKCTISAFPDSNRSVKEGSVCQIEVHVTDNQI